MVQPRRELGRRPWRPKVRLLGPPGLADAQAQVTGHRRGDRGLCDGAVRMASPHAGARQATLRHTEWGKGADAGSVGQRGSGRRQPAKRRPVAPSHLVPWRCARGRHAKKTRSEPARFQSGCLSGRGPALASPGPERPTLSESKALEPIGGTGWMAPGIRPGRLAHRPHSGRPRRPNRLGRRHGAGVRAARFARVPGFGSPVHARR